MAKNNKNNNSNSKNNNIKKQKKEHINNLKSKLRETKETGLIDGVFVYTEPLSIAEFAKKIGENVSAIIKVFFKQGIMVTQNQILTEEQMGELCLEFGYDFRKETTVTKENIFDTFGIEDREEDLEKRCPIITIMGHVDHGKTTLLDSIRNSNVIGGEFGGITQHIGAYQVKIGNNKITFLDTPGHEAFTEMRARGSLATDIVVLVVAADDGVMPQTEEAIDHAKAADVPIIVFVNKIDKPGADSNKVKMELMKFGIIAEEFGGDIPFVEGSAKAKINIDKLLETILLISELNNWKANPKAFAKGVVIEAYLDKSKGPSATILVQNGTLHMRDVVVAGSTYGIVKDIQDEKKLHLESAEPGKPVLIQGLNDVPKAGDKFLIVPDEKIARNIAEAQLEKENKENMVKNQAFTLETIKEKISSNELKEIKIVLKGDTQGTVEAIRNSILRIQLEGIKINVIRSSTGAITASDISLALASNALVYGFNIRPTASVREKAVEEGVDIRLHNIIYKLIEELENVAKSMLDPIYEDVSLGEAEVRQLFRHSDVGTIAGCRVLHGVIQRGCRVNVLRNGIVVYNGELSSLKNGKNDIKEAKQDSECGLTIKNFNDIKEGDIIEAYKIEEKNR